MGMLGLKAVRSEFGPTHRPRWSLAVSEVELASTLPPPKPHLHSRNNVRSVSGLGLLRRNGRPHSRTVSSLRLESDILGYPILDSQRGDGSVVLPRLRRRGSQRIHGMGKNSPRLSAAKQRYSRRQKSMA